MGILDKIGKIKNIKSLDDFKVFWEENNSFLKKAALPMVVAFAVVLFWFSGGEDELTIEKVAASGDVSGVASGQNIGGIDTNSGQSLNNELAMPETSKIYVDIGGEVNSPGVYEVNMGTRLFQVVERAGGLTDCADVDSINQAEAVQDGQKIIIGSNDKNSPYYTERNPNITDIAGESTGAVKESANGTVVNINKADFTELQLIPGVGPSTARKIMEYRENEGRFNSKEDIKKVSGIGDKTFEALKEYICV